MGVVIIFETIHSINYAAILPQKPVAEIAHAKSRFSTSILSSFRPIKILEYEFDILKFLQCSSQTDSAMQCLHYLKRDSKGLIR